MGAEGERRYWEIFEELFREPGFADYFGALQRYSLEQPRDPRLFEIGAVSAALSVRRPGVSARVRRDRARCRHAGRSPSSRTATWSSSRTRSSGRDYGKRPGGRVLIYIHKEQMLDDIERRYPARRYVMVEDKIFCWPP